MTNHGLDDKDGNKANLAPHKHKPLNQRLGFWLTLLLLAIIGTIFYRYTSAPVGGGNKQQTPVVVVLAKTSDIPVYISALGSVTPTYSVTVRTQINGQLMRVLFKEGQMVKAGDLLAEIDSRPYEAQRIQYEGQLARDEAQLANANIDLKRLCRLGMLCS